MNEMSKEQKNELGCLRYGWIREKSDDLCYY